MYQGFFKLPHALHLSIYNYLSPKELDHLYETYMLCNNRELSALAWRALLMKRDKGAYDYQTKRLEEVSQFHLNHLPKNPDQWIKTLQIFLKDLTVSNTALMTIAGLSYFKITTFNRLKGFSILYHASAQNGAPQHSHSLLMPNMSETYPLINRFLKNGTSDEQRYTLNLVTILLPFYPVDERKLLLSTIVQLIEDDQLYLDMSAFNCLKVFALYLKQHELANYFLKLAFLLQAHPGASNCLESILTRLSNAQIEKLIQDAFQTFEKVNKSNLKNLAGDKTLVKSLAYLTLFVQRLSSTQCCDLAKIIVSALMSLQETISLQNYRALLQYFQTLTARFTTEDSNALVMTIVSILEQGPDLNKIELPCKFIALLGKKVCQQTLSNCIETLIRLLSENQDFFINKKPWKTETPLLICLNTLIPSLTNDQLRTVAHFLFKISFPFSSLNVLLAILNCLTKMAPYLKQIEDEQCQMYLDESLKQIQHLLYEPASSFYQPDMVLNESIIAVAIRYQTAFAYRLSYEQRQRFYRKRLYPSLLSANTSERQAASDSFNALEPFFDKNERHYILSKFIQGLKDHNLETLCNFSECLPLLFKACEASELLPLIAFVTEQVKSFQAEHYPVEEADDTFNEDAPLIYLQIGLSSLTHIPRQFYRDHRESYLPLHYQLITKLSSWSCSWQRSLAYQYLKGVLPYLMPEEKANAFPLLLESFDLEFSQQQHLAAQRCLKCLVLCCQESPQSDHIKTLFNLFDLLLFESSALLDPNNLPSLLCPGALHGFMKLVKHLNKQQCLAYSFLMMERLLHHESFIRQTALECLSSLIMHLEEQAREAVFAQLNLTEVITNSSCEAITAKVYLALYNVVEKRFSPMLSTVLEELNPSTAQTGWPSLSPSF